MMRRTLDPETSVANQAKTTLGNNPKAKTKYCNPSGSFKSHIVQKNSVSPVICHRVHPHFSFTCWDPLGPTQPLSLPVLALCWVFFFECVWRHGDRFSKCSRTWRPAPCLWATRSHRRSRPHDTGLSNRNCVMWSRCRLYEGVWRSGVMGPLILNLRLHASASVSQGQELKEPIL